MRPVSKTWVEEVFSSPPAREVRGRSRWTHRVALRSQTMGKTFYLEGTGEFHACLVLEHLSRVGCVRRYKPQAFSMANFGGRPKSVPDFLVELGSGELLVIEIKTYRFLSPTVLQSLQQNEGILNEAGIRALLWTDVDPNSRWNKLTRNTVHTLRHIQRGLAFQLSGGRHQEIRALVSEKTTFGELLEHFSWDELTASLATTNIHIDIRGQLNETTRVFKNHPQSTDQHYFGTGHAASTWWDSLPNL